MHANLGNVPDKEVKRWKAAAKLDGRSFLQWGRRILTAAAETQIADAKASK